MNHPNVGGMVLQREAFWSPGAHVKDAAGVHPIHTAFVVDLTRVGDKNLEPFVGFLVTVWLRRRHRHPTSNVAKENRLCGNLSVLNTRGIVTMLVSKDAT